MSLIDFNSKYGRNCLNLVYSVIATTLMNDPIIEGRVQYGIQILSNWTIRTALAENANECKPFGKVTIVSL